VFVWRNALILGLGFIVVGVAYWFLQGDAEHIDRTGATLLILLGGSMAFTFAILLKGSRGL
jgi:hypothetical protein